MKKPDCPNVHCVDGRIVIGFPEAQQFDCGYCNSSPTEGWYWKNSPEYPGTMELYDYADRMLAFITKRPEYCDRGHYMAQIEIPCNLDAADSWPNYYMDLDRAMAEVKSFLVWRLFKVDL